MEMMTLFSLKKMISSFDECMDVDVTIDESLNIESPTDNSSDERKIQKAVHFHRLKNSWNTCWLNSIFQALWAILATDCTFSLSPNTDTILFSFSLDISYYPRITKNVVIIVRIS